MGTLLQHISLLLFNVTQHFSVRLVVTLNRSHGVREENGRCVSHVG